MNFFQEQTQAPQKNVLIYTIVPPPKGASNSIIAAHLEKVAGIIGSLPVDAIHIPEVRPETRAPRVTPFVPKMEPRSFARLIQGYLDGRVEVIVDRGMVYTHWANQRRWLLKTWRDFRIRNLVLVGGELSRVRYPGPPVWEGARLIKCSAAFGDFFLGGITIPSRRNEPERLIEKAKSGIEFFISQVFYEADHAKRLLKDYFERCLEQGTEPKRILLSFAPVSSKRDVKFLRWWGVEIPEQTERFLMRGTRGMVERSMQVTRMILAEVLDFTQEERLRIPLGLNIEHVNPRNLGASRDLGAGLMEIYSKHILSS